VIRLLNTIVKRGANNLREVINLRLNINKHYKNLPNTCRNLNVTEWVELQIASGKLLYDIMEQLLEETAQANELAQRKEYMDAAKKIQDIFLTKNMKGLEYENIGKYIEAMQLYEENIKNGFAGMLPYERLRIIYARNNRDKDVIRVCKSYIQNGYHDPQLKAEYKRIISSLKDAIDK
jgi:hypothetical protein